MRTKVKRFAQQDKVVLITPTSALTLSTGPPVRLARGQPNPLAHLSGPVARARNAETEVAVLTPNEKTRDQR